MLHLMYVSESNEQFTSESLTRLVSKSSSWNDDHAVTGFLFYDGARFIQFLEGESDEIERLFERIAADTRHEVLLVQRRTVEARRFPSWAMKLYEPPDPKDSLFSLTVDKLLSDQAQIVGMQSGRGDVSMLWELATHVADDVSTGRSV